MSTKPETTAMNTTSEPSSQDLPALSLPVVSGTSLETPQEQLQDRVIQVLCSIYDPEIPVSIYDMGLIYEVNVTEEREVLIMMTLTTPACPVAGSLPGEVEDKVRELEGVTEAKVELTWDPPWEPDMMSEEAQLELGFF